MTIEELIEELKKYPPYYPVIVANHDNDEDIEIQTEVDHGIVTIRVDVKYDTGPDETYYHFDDDTDGEIMA